MSVPTLDHSPTFALGRFSAVAIASSTGGPAVVRGIAAKLPADLPFPIFVAQHLPPTFTPGFAGGLDAASALTAIHGEDGMPVLPGVIYVGPGHQHLRVRRQRPGSPVQLDISPEPEALIYKPSGDELLRTCAAVYGGRVLAIVLTGIGHDGMDGARAVIEAGGVVLTQRADTCAVYGMPRSCDEAGLSSASLTPEGIARTILQLSPGHRGEALLAG